MAAFGAVNQDGETMHTKEIRGIPYATARHKCLRVSDLSAEETDAKISQVRRRLKSIVRHGRIYHIGSTAVGGCLTKGDIDLLLRVENVAEFRSSVTALRRFFRLEKQQPFDEEFASFRIPISDAKENVALQVTVRRSKYDVFLPFLRRLQRNPALVEAYGEVKRASFNCGAQFYRSAKQAFINRVLSEKHLGRNTRPQNKTNKMNNKTSESSIEEYLKCHNGKGSAGKEPKYGVKLVMKIASEHAIEQGVSPIAAEAALKDLTSIKLT